MGFCGDQYVDSALVVVAVAVVLMVLHLGLGAQWGQATVYPIPALA